MVLLACGCLALFAGSASAEVPAGPRLGLQWQGEFEAEIQTVDVTGGAARLVAGGGSGPGVVPITRSPVRWSADGGYIAFAGHASGDSAPIAVYLVNADGTGLRKVPGTSGGFAPVLSPDGYTLAFSRARERRRDLPNGAETTVFRSYSVWLLNMNGGAARQLTSWRNWVLDFPSSFSPDGSTLAISRERIAGVDSTRFASIAIGLDSSERRVLARNATEPVYSPDGTRLALIAVGGKRTVTKRGLAMLFTETELALANADGSRLTKLTKTLGVEAAPSWDPSGQRLAYTHLRIDPTAPYEAGSSIMQINVDGSCRAPVITSRRGAVFGAAWQPGPGREAGPISC